MLPAPVAPSVAAMMTLLHERRRIGWAALLGPPLVAAGVLVAAVSQQVAGSRGAVSSLLSLTLDVMPLMAGLGVTAIVADPVLELQLSLPTAFPVTILRRLVLCAAWPALLAAGFEIGLWLTGRRLWTPSVPLDQLIWLAPLVALAGLGLAATVTLRSVAAAGGLVAVVWLAQELLGASIAHAAWLQPVWLFYRYTDVDQTAWLANRVVLLVAGAAFGAIALWRLSRPESLLTVGGEG